LATNMIDLVVLFLAVAALARGIQRGAGREMLELAVLVAGAIAAFRLSIPAGRFVSSWSGIETLPARFMAGGVLFITFVVLGSAVAGFGHRRFGSADVRWRSRLAGGGVALLWMLLLTALVLSVAVALPLNVIANDAMRESKAVELLARPGQPTYHVVVALSGDRVLESMVNLDELIGDQQVIVENDGIVEIASAESTDIDAARDDAVTVYELLNLARVDEAVSPVAWSESLAEVAAGHAREMYLEGYFSHISPATGSVADRVVDAGIPFVIVGENLALAPTAEGVHSGLLQSPGHRANMLDQRFRRVGIGAYAGPLGLMVVQVFSG
jgi:uncharacterized protein YkwD